MVYQTDVGCRRVVGDCFSVCSFGCADSRLTGFMVLEEAWLVATRGTTFVCDRVCDRTLRLACIAIYL